MILSTGRGCEALERDLRALEATKLSINFKESIKEKLLSTVTRAKIGDEVPVRPPREILVEMIFQKAWEDEKTRCQKDSRDMTQEDLKRVMESFSELGIFREIPTRIRLRGRYKQLGVRFLRRAS